MQYQNLLFSRTWNKDHRWILTPQNMSGDDFRCIEKVMWDDNMRWKRSGISVQFFDLDYGNALCRFHQIPYWDSSGREIWAIDGIFVDREYGYDLRTFTKNLLNQDSSCLDGWDLFGFDRMDSMIRNIPPVMYY